MRASIVLGYDIKDDCFDTMGIKAIVLIFCLKKLKMASLPALLRKKPSPAGETSGTVMALSCVWRLMQQR